MIEGTCRNWTPFLLWFLIWEHVVERGSANYSHHFYSEFSSTPILKCGAGNRFQVGSSGLIRQSRKSWSCRLPRKLGFGKPGHKGKEVGKELQKSPSWLLYQLLSYRHTGKDDCRLESWADVSLLAHCWEIEFKNWTQLQKHIVEA